MARWNRGPTLLALDGTDQVLARLRTLFADFEGIFVIRKTTETRLVVSLSEEIPADAWQRYLGAAFDQPLDDDMVTDDTATAPNQLQWVAMSPKQTGTISPVQKPDSPLLFSNQTTFQFDPKSPSR